MDDRRGSSVKYEHAFDSRSWTSMMVQCLDRWHDVYVTTCTSRWRVFVTHNTHVSSSSCPIVGKLISRAQTYQQKKQTKKDGNKCTTRGRCPFPPDGIMCSLPHQLFFSDHSHPSHLLSSLPLFFRSFLFMWVSSWCILMSFIVFVQWDSKIQFVSFTLHYTTRACDEQTTTKLCHHSYGTVGFERNYSENILCGSQLRCVNSRISKYEANIQAERTNE